MCRNGSDARSVEFCLDRSSGPCATGKLDAARAIRGDRTHVCSQVITVGRALQRRAGTRQTKVVVIKCGRVSLLRIDTSSPSS